MSLFYVGFPSKEDHEDKKNKDALMVEDTADSGTEFGINKEKSYFGLWPIEHPIEPDPHQDRPVNCPLPHSSFIKEERVRFGTRRKRHHSFVMIKAISMLLLSPRALFHHSLIKCIKCFSTGNFES
ncbi:hypothetical protein F511_23625 [Dorcoceras hygrometricum]|uniref:Uncharacterized protein n=1 Tax=Dorcoceras hygrometricum TaxID=472368 RepID=A0A2Z7CNX4_9LAMI|nr:hypothetical protein F511_23625 [Dorcoceras hygrometricum]